jgi:hypothetical protein
MSEQVLYHFQIMRDGGRWESMGTGEGTGRNPVKDAFADLSSLCGSALPAGVYRYLPADRLFDARWRYLSVNRRGAVRIER